MNVTDVPIYENEMEEESMMTLDSIMANMPMEEREIIMDKMVKASRDILETIADMGYLDEYGTPLTSMEERNYRDELGQLAVDQISCDGYEFGIGNNLWQILNTSEQKNLTSFLFSGYRKLCLPKKNFRVFQQTQNSCMHFLILFLQWSSIGVDDVTVDCHFTKISSHVFGL